MTWPIEPSDWQRLLLAYLAMFSLAAGLCACFLSALLKTGLAWRIALDRPNERSLHTSVTPRCGGWGILLAVLAFLGAVLPLLWPVTCGVVLLAIVSFIDDRHSLPVVVRLVPQLAAVGLVLASQTGGLPWWLGLLCALGWLWMINLYNFMDGSDGLAGTMTLIGFGTYAIALGGGAPLLSILSLATSGAALGFLFFNWSPARVFLGDAGSIPLGFLAAAIGFLGYRDAQWPLWMPLVVFSPFVADASVTLMRRAWRRERVWRAHREHYYQRLIQSGLSHRATCLIYGAAMLGAGAVALLLRAAPAATVWIGLAGWLALLVALGYWIDRRAALRALRAAA